MTFDAALARAEAAREEYERNPTLVALVRWLDSLDALKQAHEPVATRSLARTGR